MKKQGYVYLIGAGPGDIRLMTLKGLECIQQADVILYDRLVNPLLLEWTKPEAELVYCGKLPQRHVLRQDAINELLVKYGQAGKIVVRLKGGDPSVFGRVGEEAEALEANHVPYEIVPGVTAGIGAATYAGVPVTHRDYGASFAVITGHDKSESGHPLIDWKGLASAIDTIAFYMGVGNLQYISDQLIKHGRDPKTPVLLIQWGTIGKQQTLEGTLDSIAQKAMETNFKNPAITLVGDVVKLRKGKSWFERQPLFNQHILLGRTGDEPSLIAKRLREYGADVFEFPRWRSQSTLMDMNVEEYEQILFTSPKSVECFFAWLKEKRIDVRFVKARFYGASVKSIRAIEQFACIAEPVHAMIDDKKLLILGDDTWEAENAGRHEAYGQHDFVMTHSSTKVSQAERTFQRLLDEDRIKTIIFPSAKSVRVVSESLESCGQSPERLSSIAKIICFGEKSRTAAIECGYHVDDTLPEPSADALLKALCNE
ncbi:uroporphyrinogen-III C-methyltransferase [Halalkalibacter urbisdiaboli]|uniref:uroporphyrinogen-III C-methyltransferase n=1 Tax=Halalkalibacter urbisdiaboli TaxID=1960589 RepID=UPI000B42F8EB|nr:uroporphyrinogen-III C-methyltransferase [Halalkalibacter urbisdiaboli]